MTSQLEDIINIYTQAKIIKDNPKYLIDYVTEYLILRNNKNHIQTIQEMKIKYIK